MSLVLFDIVDIESFRERQIVQAQSLAQVLILHVIDDAGRDQRDLVIHVAHPPPRRA